MKKHIIYVSSLACSLTVYGLSPWQQPNVQLRYHEVAFLTSHNSYAAKRHGFLHAQQYWTIQEQLEHGVRGLMLDTYYNSTKTDVVLCHGNLFMNRILRKGKPPMPFNESLRYVKEFLEQNPQEIVTIILENYVDNKELLDTAIRSSGIESLVLKPGEWNTLCSEGWPTLAWMQQNNKRVVFFNSIEKTELTFNQWEYMVENQYGVLTTKHACKERNESQKWRTNKRHLYLVNYFSTFKMNLGKAYHHINTRNLEQLMEEIKNGLDEKGLYKMRLPNFIAIDYVNEGDAMKYVNRINQLAQDAKQREKFFACLLAKL